MVMTCFERHNVGMITVQARLVLIVLSVCCTVVVADGRPTTRLPSTPPLHERYRLDIRLLVGGNPAARINTTRDWSTAFQRIGQRVKIVPDRKGETPGIVNDKFSVRVTGLIDRKGAVRFNDKTFRRTDVESLKKFLTSLEEHGAGGPVRQRSTWGLSDEQYAEVLSLLATDVPQKFSLSPSVVADVEAMELPGEMQVTWSNSAKAVALKSENLTAIPEVKSLSKGTGLAVALAQRGLGFRVMRHPQSGYLVEIDEGNEASNLWPIGWKNKKPLPGLLPALYRSVDVDLSDVAVELVITDVADRAKIPWLASRHHLAAAGVQLEELQTSRRPSRISPQRLLHSIGAKNHFSIEARTDESGTLFLWCTTVADQKAWKQRFARSAAGRTERSR